jgi:hypothetical protein
VRALLAGLPETITNLVVAVSLGKSWDGTGVKEWMVGKMRNTKTPESRNFPKHEFRLFVTLNHFSSTFQSHLFIEGHVHALLLTMQL